MINFKKIGLLLLVQAAGLAVLGQVRMPRIFSDNMLVQRDKPLKVWGWAAAGEAVTVRFNGQQARTKAARDGSWQVLLKPMTFGGPFELSVTGKNSLVYKNVLIGDVWICSGQSNMEWILKDARDGAREVRESSYPSIRLFTVKRAMSFTPQQDVAGGTWQECGPATSADFSAVAYFFGRKLHTDEKVPIGLISTSWGGTNIEAWTSWDLMKQDSAWQHTDLKEIEKSQATMMKKLEDFRALLQQDKGTAEKWFDPATSVTGWKTMALPQLWEQTEVGNADGVVWFRKDFDLPEGWSSKPATLSLGPIDDSDMTYVNGLPVGGTNQYNTDRNYTLAPGLLHAGRNTVVVKVVDNGGGGGIYGQPQQLSLHNGGEPFSLAGSWLYKAAALTTDFGIQDFGPNGFPSQLFNAMIAPVVPYAIKGGIWYQGESNTFEAYKYRSLFPQMINDWRRRWGYDFPFVWAQLANYMAPSPVPVTTEWAELREAQTRTLSLPATGQAVLIDIGEAGDIHPRNKQDVGHRLALAAEKVAYGRNIVYSGPVYKSMKVEGNRIVLSFENTGGGLVAKDRYGYLKGFAIAGADGKFVWAKATILGNSIVVYSDAVQQPVAVRYAWADNPDDANLYNTENLPAGPFRTDSWKGITEH